MNCAPYKRHSTMRRTYRDNQGCLIARDGMSGRVCALQGLSEFEKARMMCSGEKVHRDSRRTRLSSELGLRPLTVTACPELFGLSGRRAISDTERFQDLRTPASRFALASRAVQSQSQRVERPATSMAAYHEDFGRATRPLPLTNHRKRYRPST